MMATESTPRVVRRSATRLCVLVALTSLTTFGCSSTSPGPTVASVVITPGFDTLRNGDSIQLEASAYDHSGALLPGVTLAWGPQPCSMCGPGFVLLSSTGKLKVIQPWPDSLIVTATAPNGVVGTSTLILNPPLTTNVAYIIVTPNVDTLVVGALVQLTATALTAQGVIIPGVTFGWGADSAGYNTIVSVTATGKVTALAAGAALVVAEVNNVTGSAAILDTLASPSGSRR